MQHAGTDIVKAELTLLQCPINSQQQFSSAQSATVASANVAATLVAASSAAAATASAAAATAATACGTPTHNNSLVCCCCLQRTTSTSPSFVVCLSSVVACCCCCCCCWGYCAACGKHIKPDVTPNIATELFHVGAVNKCPAKHPQRTSLRANPVLKSLNEI